MANTKTPTIKLLVKENPKRGISAKRFALYKDGMTVAAYCEAADKVPNKDGKPGKYGKADIAWDTKRGYIKVVQA